MAHPEGRRQQASHVDFGVSWRLRELEPAVASVMFVRIRFEAYGIRAEGEGVARQGSEGPWHCFRAVLLTSLCTFLDAGLVLAYAPHLPSAMITL